VLIITGLSCLGGPAASGCSQGVVGALAPHAAADNLFAGLVSRGPYRPKVIRAIIGVRHRGRNSPVKGCPDAYCCGL
jgi:hypothetical protein